MSNSGSDAVFIRRFDAFDRVLHGVLMFSFLGLAATGLPLIFSEETWARALARVFGGFVVAGWLHRVCAILLIGLFTVHLTRIGRRIIVGRRFDLLWGPHSMVPQPRDVRDLVQHVRWFLGRGPRPRFDRFTYWEKFDYWAVFWGMAIIGGSGLLLWFPEFFARFLPGWVFNVALLVHGEEALLAVGFIFTLHFFNGHLRPEKFPMDTVIFTGHVTTEELEEDRPAEYERLRATGQLEALRVPPAPPWLERLGRTVGTIAIVIGLSLVGLILYAVLT
ncbi:MAG TPA: cytochrome b/b6 domain-containing protein [Vicinamibacterales bacterium]|nr:cytochrome b/b6 domain-containing protein [Vicinamibacterales bacterium]